MKPIVLKLFLASSAPQVTPCDHSAQCIIERLDGDGPTVSRNQRIQLCQEIAWDIGDVYEEATLDDKMNEISMPSKLLLAEAKMRRCLRE